MLAYSSRNRSAAIRVPVYSNDARTKRLEVRFPDPSANPYLAFAAVVMAALDGIQNQIDPPEPMDNDVELMSDEEREGIATTPTGLSRSLRALEADHDYLLQGDVFSKQLIRYWIDYKMENEVNPMRLRPTPTEFGLYYDC